MPSRLLWGQGLKDISTLNIQPCLSLKSQGLKSLGLKSPELKLGVEKFRVEMSCDLFFSIWASCKRRLFQYIYHHMPIQRKRNRCGLRPNFFYKIDWLAHTVVHKDLCLVEMFHNYGFIEWIFLKYLKFWLFLYFW